MFPQLVHMKSESDSMQSPTIQRTHTIKLHSQLSLKKNYTYYSSSLMHMVTIKTEEKQKQK